MGYDILSLLPAQGWWAGGGQVRVTYHPDTPLPGVRICSLNPLCSDRPESCGRNQARRSWLSTSAHPKSAQEEPQAVGLGFRDLWSSHSSGSRGRSTMSLWPVSSSAQWRLSCPPVWFSASTPDLEVPTHLVGRKAPRLSWSLVFPVPSQLRFPSVRLSILSLPTYWPSRHVQSRGGPGSLQFPSSPATAQAAWRGWGLPSVSVSLLSSSLCDSSSCPPKPISSSCGQNRLSQSPVQGGVKPQGYPGDGSPVPARGWGRGGRGQNLHQSGGCPPSPKSPSRDTWTECFLQRSPQPCCNWKNAPLSPPAVPLCLLLNRWSQRCSIWPPKSPGILGKWHCAPLRAAGEGPIGSWAQRPPLFFRRAQVASSEPPEKETCSLTSGRIPSIWALI